MVAFRRGRTGTMSPLLPRTSCPVGGLLTVICLGYQDPLDALLHTQNFPLLMPQGSLRSLKASINSRKEDQVVIACP